MKDVISEAVLSSDTAKKLNSTFDSALEGVLDAAKEVKDFTVEQAGDLAKEVVMEQKTILENVVILNVLIAGGSLLMFYSLLALLQNYTTIITGYDEIVKIVLGVATFVMGATSGIYFAKYMIQATKSGLELRVLKAAPKFFLIKKVKEYLNK